jgi:hypothetical protein
MKIGMLWFDNDPNTDLAEKIERAAAYYLGKYKQTPTMCFVHPTMLVGCQTPITIVDVRANSAIQPNYLWLGVSSD